MRMKVVAALGAVAVALTSISVGDANAQEPPKGWIQAGQNPSDYETAVDAKGGRNGGACAYIKAKTTAAQTFGTLMQTFEAGEYKGKRLRLSAWVKSAGIAKWAGLWMRIDGPMENRGYPAMLGFDNMQNRPIKGTTDWKRYDVVLDVPAPAVSVNFGILLEGAGQAWLDGVKFDVVGPEVSVTQVKQEFTLPKEPVNLDFEQH
jgi:hypothetical protein